MKERATAFSFLMTLISSASSLPSIRISLRLRKNQAQAKNFCRVLDIRVAEIVKSDLGNPGSGEDSLQHIVHAVRGDRAAVGGREHILVVGLGFLLFQNFYRLG